MITNSSHDTNKKEIIENINKDIRNFLNSVKFYTGYDIFVKMTANENNCFFVDFKDQKNNLYDSLQLFNKLLFVLKETDLYKTYNKDYSNNEEYNELLKKEAELRKLRAKDIIFNNTIGKEIKGIKNGISLAVHKDTIKKIANIFGLEVINMKQKNDNENIDYCFNENNFEIIEAINNNYYTKKELITNNYKQVYINYLSIGKGSGITSGYYFSYESCEKFIDELFCYFEEKISTLSGSILKAAEYLEWRRKNIK